MAEGGRVTTWNWGRRVHPTIKDEFAAWRSFSWTGFFAVMIVIPGMLVSFVNTHFLGLSQTHVGLWLLLLPAVMLLTVAPIFAFYAVIRSCMMLSNGPPAVGVDKLFKFSDKRVRAWFGRKLNKTVPISSLHDAYMAERMDVKGDMLETLYQRRKYSNFRLTFEHIKFFLFHLVPETIVHSRSQDRAQVTDHYNRGNDFYAAFLGKTMTYTSAFFKHPEDSLEEAQVQKFDLVCRKLHLQKGDKHLDLGCGWGTLLCHAAKEYGSCSIGVSLAIEQIKWAKNLAKQYGVNDTSKKFGWVKPMCLDYRDTPRDYRYNKISCLEMSEHVGIRNYDGFLAQVYDMLEDDGLFYLQIAGIRRSWQFEDLNWGLFMGKYVFPGADASAPISLVVGQLEKAGFEVHSVENVGIHYSATIKRWYDNWQSNKREIVQKYGEKWWRQWNWFLAWSVISPEQGSATCYQIICHKNTSSFDRKIFIGEQKTLKY